MERVLITDTSVLLNLLATEHAADILATAGWTFCICEAVRREALVLRNRDTQETRPLDFAPMIKRKLLVVCEATGETEFKLLVEYAALLGRGSDGEAMSFAIAESRSLPVAIDDERAVKRAGQRCPSLVVLRTTDVLKAWQRKNDAAATKVGEQFRRIELWASYFPGPRHPDYSWWHANRAAAK